MYESPITIIKTETGFIKEIAEKTEEECYKAVVKVLPNVNKEELIKALQYDREQYVKGYKDRDSEIVKCCDCVYCNVLNTKDIYVCCVKHGIKFYPFEDDTRTHFCSWGERKE